MRSCKSNAFCFLPNELMSTTPSSLPSAFPPALTSLHLRPCLQQRIQPPSRALRSNDTSYAIRRLLHRCVCVWVCGCVGVGVGVFCIFSSIKSMP